MQLSLDFTPKSQRRPFIKHPTWLNVSEIARGVGFTSTVEVSHALSDALEPLQTEDEDGYAYDQRLYDALWLSHFQLTRDHRESATFNFTFLRKDWKTEEDTETRLRLRVEMQKGVLLLGLLQDF